ncbi:MAG: hypothetical protein U0270_03755 [Labilithrix sp.]
MLDLQKMLRDAVAELDRETELDQRQAARAFLRNLDPGSQEGMWFEALAERFPSRLEAAVAYLRDVKR